MLWCVPQPTTSASIAWWPITLTIMVVLSNFTTFQVKLLILITHIPCRELEPIALHRIQIHTNVPFSIQHKSCVKIPFKCENKYTNDSIQYGQNTQSWWRHQIEAFSALLTLCAGNSPVTGEFPAQRDSDAELWCFLWSAPWINGWVKNREAGDLRRNHAH